MDNAAFRSLLSKSPQDGSSNAGAATFRKPTNLGSRARSSIPMTPRHIQGHNASREFARQVAEHTSTNPSEPPLKKFKSSAAPKGSKLGADYVDRVQLRRGQEEGDDKATRLKNLEEQLKLGQIDQTQFEKLREQIGVGGDLGSTHLVKGLDWKLLERVKRGEDVNESAAGEENKDRSGQAENNVDEELELALEKEVIPRPREDHDENNGSNMQRPQQVLTRNEILRQFREQRVAPSTSSAPVLNDRFKKVASSEKPGKKKFVESINGRRREVLVITNKDGTTKRKTRWIDAEDFTKPEQQPLGMEIPADVAMKQKAALEAEAAKDENEDIFADAGNDYDPLAGINSEDEDEDTGVEQKGNPRLGNLVDGSKRNYFSTNDTVDKEVAGTDNPAGTDPTFLAALKRAAEIRKREEETGDQPGDSGTHQDGTTTRTKASTFLAKLQERERRDAADFDYGFGESRFGDDDDDDAGPIYNDDEGEQKKSGRKRGPKKRKGDKDSMKDVMSVLDGRHQK